MQGALDQLYEHVHRHSLHNQQRRTKNSRISSAHSLHSCASCRSRFKGNTAGGMPRRLDLLSRSVLEASRRPLEFHEASRRDVNRAATEGDCSTAFLLGDRFSAVEGHMHEHLYKHSPHKIPRYWYPRNSRTRNCQEGHVNTILLTCGAAALPKILPRFSRRDSIARTAMKVKKATKQ